jgi:hypothetical protein
VRNIIAIHLRRLLKFPMFNQVPVAAGTWLCFWMGSRGSVT